MEKNLTGFSLISGNHKILWTLSIHLPVAAVFVLYLVVEQAAPLLSAGDVQDLYRLMLSFSGFAGSCAVTRLFWRHTMFMGPNITLRGKG